MRTGALVVMFCLFLVTSAESSDWSWQDTTLQVTFTTMALLDRSQTLQIKTKSPEGEYFSVLLGKHPTHERVNRVFIPYIIGHAVVSYLLPKGWLRTGWQIGFIAFETSNVNHNMRMGYNTTLHISF